MLSTFLIYCGLSPAFCLTCSTGLHSPHTICRRSYPGLMRCACVAIPLKFKFIFTRSRTIQWVMVLVVLAVFLRLPVLTIHRMSWRTDPQTSVSLPYLKAVNTAYMDRINDILNRGIVIYILCITVVTCVYVF